MKNEDDKEQRAEGVICIEEEGSDRRLEKTA
jgi:hypothetical protein